MMKKVLLLTIVCLASLALWAGGAWGATMCVDPGGTGTHTDLQSALTAAQANGAADTIKVVQGVYYDNFTFSSSEAYSITLEGGYLPGTGPGTGCASREVDPSNTVLDGLLTGSALLLDNDAGGDITVDGVTIQNGYYSGDGAGLYAYSSDSTTAGTVTLTNNIIRRNTSEQGGGGVYARSYSDSGTAGTVILVNNTITENNANVGGGVFASSYSPSGTAGTVTCTNNTITDNTAGTEGGGANLYAFSSGLPGGILNCYNNIMWGNTGPTAADIYVQNYPDCTTNGYNNDYSDIDGSWDNGTGTNIDANPQFIDHYHGDYRLQSTSPCKDTGLNSAPQCPTTDFEGDPRPINTIVDIGADEVSVLTTCVSTFGGLNSALSTAQTNSIDDVIMVQEGTYTQTGNFDYSSGQSYSITLLGGYDSGCASRAIDPAGTVLHGDGTGTVLSLNDSGGGDIRVDGFTVNNGLGATDGGGVKAISSNGSDPSGDITLANNIVTGNNASNTGGGVSVSSTTTGGGSAGDVTLVNNIVTGNTATGTGFGGGVHAASNASSGGAAGTVTCTNNTLTGNGADEGGGIYVFVYGSPGGIIYAYNNIVWGNTATTAGGDVSFDQGTGSAYGYNNDATNVVGTWNYSGGNINADPIFVNAGAGNYHLGLGSPCIDAGTNDAPALPGTDFEDDQRMIDGDNDTTATVDIGADEYIPIEEMIILHRDGALWSTNTGWTLTTPPYYAGSDYARDLELIDGVGYEILHKDGAIYDSISGWDLGSPPYYAGSDYAKDLELLTALEAVCILHRDGALWRSDTGWVLTSPPYYAGSDYARALELRGDTSYVILHQYGGLYDSASGWVLTSPPYYAGSAWVVDLKLEASGYVLLHKDGALWSSSGGWMMTAPPYYAGSDYARALEMVGSRYIIQHKDGAIYDSYAGWTLTSPPYYSGSNYAVDLEVR